MLNSSADPVTFSHGFNRVETGLFSSHGYHDQVLVDRWAERVHSRWHYSHERRPGCSSNASISDCAISKTSNCLGISTNFFEYNEWAGGDDHLDWYGAEVGQGTSGGASSLGTPMAWTTDDASNAGYHPMRYVNEPCMRTCLSQVNAKHRVILSKIFFYIFSCFVAKVNIIG